MPLLAHFAKNMVYFFLLIVYSFKAEGDDNNIHSCHFDVDIIQSHHVCNSPIVSSLLVADINADGTLDIITITFDGTIDIVDGENMKPHPGSAWPYQFPNSTIHASPMLFDVDGDGMREVLICTTDGEINYFKLDGTLLPDKTVQIPPFMVSKQWLNEEPSVDTTISEFVRTFSSKGHQTDDFISCDAHILATPTLADLDGDGRKEELALPVSYYHQLDSPRTDDSSGNSMDLVVGALIILNLTSGDFIHEIPLHLSKQSAPSPAYLLYPPTVADLDGKHGPPEVIIATASGLLHTININGQPRPGFPLHLDGGAITGQISVDDLDGDGIMEMIVLQTSGDVTCLSNHGFKMWSSKISARGSSIPGSRLADLNSDGWMDVIIPTADGNVWALSGKTGTPLSHWPVHVGSRLVSNVVITSLLNSSQVPDIITVGYDGNLYIISSSSLEGTPCIEAIDLGESSLTPVHVADMIPSMPGVEMIAATTHGSIMLMSTQSDEMIDSMEMKDTRWTDATSDKHFAYRQTKYGVFVRRDTKLRSYISGTTFIIDFHIEDKDMLNTYIIQVFAGSICLHPSVSYSQPGLYALEVATPNHPITALVEVHMTNHHGQVFVDSFPVSFNTKVTDDIQWMLVLPTIAMAILLLILYGYPEVDLLPTSHSYKER